MTATLIPFPPRLVDLQPFSERECPDFLFNPDPQLQGAGRLSQQTKWGSGRAKSDGLPLIVDRGRCEAGTFHPFNAPQAATNSDHRDPSIAVKAAGAGVSSSTPASATYSPWRTRRGVYWS